MSNEPLTHAQKVFRTHTGEQVSGERLTAARAAVADFWERNARATYAEDEYAAHVSQETKDEALREGLERAERIRQGTEPMGFWLWQRVNAELTGECVPLFLPR